eukprot:CAMPEP_0198429682 /NCGR_PEP_ID=MMETSP1452-20131203/8960_1 /TAXON_ID=1181717 /ORGANISM="Synchroma pusillum, Strain CCMP3072" /LENGTH=97 /DNA_ID=CAMNT_0044150101 /DNA_START=288 /DNA_END=578 /DNA_ORIENTATION=+
MSAPNCISFKGSEAAAEGLRDGASRSLSSARAMMRATGGSALWFTTTRSLPMDCASARASSRCITSCTVSSSPSASYTTRSCSYSMDMFSDPGPSPP